MSYSARHSLGYYGGGTIADEVPALYPCALDNHPYLIDRAINQHAYRTIPLLTQQTQTSDKLGERSINPAGKWRSSVESWHRGAGQTYYDRSDSDGARFRSSKGVDPWTKWELTLLNDTTQFSSSANTNLYLAPTSTRLFWLDGTDVKYDDDLSGSPSTMTGSPGGAWSSITSDGYYVYATDGTNVYRWLRSDTAVGAAWNTLDCTLLKWVKGRLMAAKDENAYNITSSTPPAAMTMAAGTVSTDWEWVDFAAGKSVIYGAGYQGDKSLIFRSGIKSDATGLDVWVQAGELPDGEIVRSIESYLGFVLIGTDQGWRFATAGDNGDLTLGALVETSSAVRCFEGQGSFVWWGYTNYDTASTGLGRMSLTTLNETVPAYASDLMATAQGAVLDVCTFLDKRVFTVSGSGVWVQSADFVSSGVMYDGWESFGIPDNKVALNAQLRHEPLAGTVAVGLATDGATTYTSLGTSDTASTIGAEFTVGERTAERFETSLTLNRGSVSTAPTVTRRLLQAVPTADTGMTLRVPLLLSEVDQIGETSRLRDPAAELAFIETLRRSRDVVTYQSGSRRWSVQVEDFTFIPDQMTSDGTAWQGTVICDMRVV